MSILLTLSYAGGNFYYYQDKKIFLTPIQSSVKIQRSYSKQTNKINYYKTRKGDIVGIGKELIIKLKDGAEPQSLVNKYHIIIKKRLIKNIYLVEVNNTKETLNTSNKLTFDDNVIYAQPNFIKRMQQR